MREITFEQRPYTRDQVEVTWLVVAPPEPHEDADDLGIPLRAQARVVGEKNILVDAHRPHVTVEHPALDFGGNVAAGILKQRHEVVGRMTDKRVLEIKQALLLQRAEQHDVLGMIVAQHRYARTLVGQQFPEHRFPGRREA